MLNKMMPYLTVVLLLFAAPLADAEERFGIPVYPGATTDASTAWHAKKYAEGFEKRLKNKASLEVHCYRTGDDFAKVTAFYKKQPQLMLLTATGQGPQKSAMFCGTGVKCASRGNGQDVTIQSPWADDKAKLSDTLIILMQARKK